MRLIGETIDITTLDNGQPTQLVDGSRFEISGSYWNKIIISIEERWHNEELLGSAAVDLLKLYFLKPEIVRDLVVNSQPKIYKYLTEWVRGKQAGKVMSQFSYLATVILLKLTIGILPLATENLSLSLIDQTIAEDASITSNTLQALLAQRFILPTKQPLVNYPDATAIQIGGLNNFVSGLLISAYVRLIWPEMFAKIDFSRYPDPYTLISQELGDPQQLLKLLWSLEIVYADDVFIDNKGINWGQSSPNATPVQPVELPPTIIY